jgi:hypothetical protein
MAAQPSIQDLIDQVALLQNEVTTLRANQPIGAGAGATGVTPPTPVIFAATPGNVKVEDLIPYGTKGGDALYKTGVAPLPHGFDMKSGDTVMFIQDLQEKAREMGWSEGSKAITEFNIGTLAAPVMKNLFEHYGQIPVDKMKTACDVWMIGVDKETRAFQNNEMMQQCMKATLTVDASRRLLAHKATFTINGKIYAPLLFKQIMKLAIIDSRATGQYLRDCLNNMDAYMIKCGSDIDQFHEYFTTCHTQLIGRGEVIDDIRAILWKGYAVCEDVTFREWMQGRRDEYLEERDWIKDITHEELIAMATTKFNLLRQEGKWGAKSPEQQQLIALSAEMEKLRGELKLAGKAKIIDSHKPKDKEKFKKKKDGDKGKTKNKKITKDKQKQKIVEEWKKKPAAPGESKTKVVEGKTYYWCNHHMSWVLHPPADCYLGKKLAAEAANPSDTSSHSSYVSNSAVSGINGLQGLQALMGNMQLLSQECSQE